MLGITPRAASVLILATIEYLRFALVRVVHPICRLRPQVKLQGSSCRSCAQNLRASRRSQQLQNMSLSVSREVARNVGEALEILRRPGHDFGREFFLKTGTDPHRDASLLSSTDVLCNANAATNEFEFILPSADDESPSPGPGKMSVAYVQAPLITGTLTCGLCVLMQTSETSFLGMGRIVYFAGRYVRCEATGECLSFVRPFRGGGDTNVRGAVLVYSRRDSPGGHFLMFAVTRLGVAMRQMYDDYERGDQGALYGNFTFLQRGAQIPVDGCSQCGLITARGCNCDLGATMPKTSFDFRCAIVFPLLRLHQKLFSTTII